MSKKIIKNDAPPKKGDIVDLGRGLAEDLNKHYKSSEHKASFLSEENESEVVDYVSTGCTSLDYIISNRRNGGIPVGRITEVYGLEGSGKSLLMAHIVKSTQQKNGQAVYIDTENAISREFFEAIGINSERLIVLPLDTIEDVFEAIEKIIEKFRAKTTDTPLTIIVDSVMGASTKQELESNYDKDGYATTKSQIIGKAMRKIVNYVGKNQVCLVFTNQLRINLTPLAAEKYTTSGGKGLPFAASVRVRLSRKNKIVNKNGDIIGYKTEAVVDKNRLGPPKRKTVYSIYFTKGLDDVDSLLEALIQYKIIEKKGAWLSYKYVNMETAEVEEVSFQSTNFEEKVFNIPKYNEHLLDELEKNMVIPYDDVKGEVIDETDVNYILADD